MDRKKYGAMVPVRIVEEEDAKRSEAGFASEWQKYGFMLKKDVEKMSKKAKPTILFLTCVVAWTAVTCGITGVIVRHNTTIEVRDRVTSELRQGYQRYEDQKREEENRANFLSGDKSKQAAIESMVKPVAEHIAGLRMDRGVTTDGVKTYVWGVDFSRLKSGRYGSIIQEVLEGTVEGYVKGHGTRSEDDELALQLCTAYINGELPDRWTPDLEFAEINADGSVTARSKLYTDSMTKFWRYES